jgi:hypothetical protein
MFKEEVLYKVLLQMLNSLIERFEQTFEKAPKVI